LINWFINEWIRSACQRIIFNFLISIDMVENSSKFSFSHLILVLVDLLNKVVNSIVHLKFIFDGFWFASALLFAWITNNWISSLSVVANRGKASWKEGNRISSNIDSGWVSYTVEPFSPFLVSNSRSSKSNNLDIFKLFGGQDINETKSSKSSS
jgi:hypothetical protein